MPGVGETLDWAEALDQLGEKGVTAEAADRTLGALIKSREDLDQVRRTGIERLIDSARRAESQDDPPSEAA